MGKRTGSAFIMASGVPRRCTRLSKLCLITFVTIHNVVVPELISSYREVESRDSNMHVLVAVFGSGIAWILLTSSSM